MQLKNQNLYKRCSFINGEWYQAEKTFDIENPANNQIFAKVSEVTDEQLELAVNSASDAFSIWQSFSVDERVSILRNWYQLILDNSDDLALIMTAEQGKTNREAKGEVIYGAKYIEWYMEEARRVNGDILPVSQKGQRSLVLKQPIGVVSSITPWNFPSAMILRKAAPALAAGCSFIVKPSELTPLSALALAELASQAGFPPGVFNIVVGSDSQVIGEVLTTHPKITKFSFTGSTLIGKKLLAQCASTVKNTSMELGGNSPFIVFDDADIDLALKGAMISKFRNCGQTCTASNRLFVHRDIYQSFVERLSQKISKIKVAEGNQEGASLGPMINQKAIKKVEDLVNQAVQSGAKVICGGKRIAGDGNFYEPTILTDVTPDMNIFNAEIFGPVSAIIPFGSEHEVIQLANQTRYGLAAYAYTQNLNRIWRLSEQLEFGMVGINEGMIANPAAPFGGIKESGMGREGGRWGIDDYFETRYVCIGGVE